MASILNATTSSGLVTSADNSGSLQLATNNGTTAVTITTAQDVGIGTTTPAVKLDVTGTVVASGLNARITNTDTDASARAAIQFKTGASSNVWQTFAVNGALVTGVAGVADYMRITSGGSLCIGRTTNIFGSGAGLCVETNSNSINAVVTNSGQSALNAVNTAVNTGTSCSLMSFNVGISSGGSQVGSITYNGTIVQYNTTSDQRLKKNIVDAGSGLAKLANVKIRAFDWVEHNSHTDFGVVAQELNEVAPEAVNAGDTGETIKRIWAVDTSTLVPAMIKAIQELKAELDATKAEVQALKGVA